jgi:hypothetical protein
MCAGVLPEGLPHIESFKASILSGGYSGKDIFNVEMHLQKKRAFLTGAVALF